VDTLLRIVARALKKQAVLIVDDAITFASSLAEGLRAIGLRVDVTYDGDSAVELIARDKFDVCVLDLIMPGIDGVETYRRFNELPHPVDVVAITGGTDPEMVRKIADLGAFTCLRKPFKVDELVQVI